MIIMINQMKIGDKIIILYSWGMGWPYFIEFMITEIKDNGYLGIHYPGSDLVYPDPPRDKEIIHNIELDSIVPSWLTSALIHAWNTYYKDKKQLALTEIIYSIAHYVRRQADYSNEKKRKRH